jgi:hypothetical protein
VGEPQSRSGCYRQKKHVHLAGIYSPFLDRLPSNLITIPTELLQPKSTKSIAKSTIFWDMKPCRPLKVNRCFGGTCRLYLQGRNKEETSKKRVASRVEKLETQTSKRGKIISERMVEPSPEFQPNFSLIQVTVVRTRSFVAKPKLALHYRNQYNIPQEDEISKKLSLPLLASQCLGSGSGPRVSG